MIHFLLVGFGGALGAMSRYAIQKLSAHSVQLAFPWATFVINVLGCFLIGWCFENYKERWNIETWLLVGTGFLGGFTTFSAFGMETIALIRNGEFLTAGIYVLGSVLLGLVAVGLGIWIANNN